MMLNDDDSRVASASCPQVELLSAICTFFELVRNPEHMGKASVWLMFHTDEENIYNLHQYTFP